VAEQRTSTGKICSLLRWN